MRSEISQFPNGESDAITNGKATKNDQIGDAAESDAADGISRVGRLGTRQRSGASHRPGRTSLARKGPSFIGSRRNLSVLTPHPAQHGSLQGTSLSLEDGAVLAKLFSHLSSKDQITSFLYAFQDLRISRCKATSDSELGNVVFMTLPPGDHQMGRDMMLRQKDAAGLNVLTPDDDDESSIASERWEQVKFMFGYDCEDEADNWWVQWGLLAMRAKGFDMRTDNSAVTYHMNEVIS